MDSFVEQPSVTNSVNTETTSKNPFKRGDIVVYQKKKYYFQPNGESCYLYRYRDEVGYPNRSVDQVPQTDIKPPLYNNIRSDLTVGNIVVYNGHFYRYGVPKISKAKGSDYENCSYLIDKHEEVVHRLGFPELTKVQALRFKPGDRVLFRDQIYRIQYKLGDDDYELVDHKGKKYRCYNLVEDNHYGLKRFWSLEELVPVPDGFLDPMFLFNELMMIKKKLQLLGE